MWTTGLGHGSDPFAQKVDKPVSGCSQIRKDMMV
jgi:hypothetical protein